MPRGTTLLRMNQRPDTQQNQTWQQEVARSRLTPEQLCSQLQLPENLALSMVKGDQLFPIRAPQSYLNRIEPCNEQDPLLKQILPTEDEAVTVSGYSADPVGAHHATHTEGVLQKYHGRALLITTASCPIHCRYCFRRAYPYQDNRLSLQNSQAIEWIDADQSLHEVILSGGDPLMLSNDRLETLINRLGAISHLKTLRIHSRIPVVLPERIDHTLLNHLEHCRLNVVMVIHCNHPLEIDDTARAALSRLKPVVTALLNQSVLLKGINDSTAVLEQLSHTLFNAGVLPYYLHLLDRVNGSHHFEVEESMAHQFLQTLRSLLPGYLVPKLVREIAGEPCKSPRIE